MSPGFFDRSPSAKSMSQDGHIHLMGTSLAEDPEGNKEVDENKFMLTSHLLSTSAKTKNIQPPPNKQTNKQTLPGNNVLFTVLLSYILCVLKIILNFLTYLKSGYIDCFLL